jgi:hypothetical protein
MTNFRSLAVIVLLLGCVLWVIHHLYHLPALLGLRNINKLRAVLLSWRNSALMLVLSRVSRGLWVGVVPQNALGY